MSSSRSLKMELQMLLQDFYSITQINISYLPLPPEKKYTAPLRPIASAVRANDFLSQLYRLPEWKKRGEHMAVDAVNHVCIHSEEHFSYHPFPGLTIFVLPVCSRGVQLGCLLYGPVRETAQIQNYPNPFTSLHRIHTLDINTLQALYEQLPVCEEAALLASSRLLSQIVVYANSIDSPALQSPPLSVRIAEYIEAQYMNPISPSTACEYFHISRTTLSRTLTKEFSTTFLSLLNRRRIKNVCKCLEDGMSPEEASIQSGFSSATYMTRLFRTAMGCTPHAYRETIAQISHAFRPEDAHTTPHANDSSFCSIVPTV